jgi:outer membrane protein TolC
MRPRRLLPLAAALVVATAAHAAEAPPPAAAGIPDTLRLTLQGAIDRAMMNNPQVRIAEQTVKIAEARVTEAVGNALPQINGGITYSRRFSSVFEGSAGDSAFSFLGDVLARSPFAAENTWDISLTGSQLLFSQPVSAAVSGAKAYRRGALADRSETVNDVALQVQRAYLQAALGGRVADIALAGLRQARDQESRVSLFFDQGARSEYDLLRAQVDARNQEPVVVQALDARDLALLDLKRLLALPAEQPVALSSALEFEDGLVPVVQDSLFAYESRPALQRAEADVELRKQAKRYEAGAYWPSLTLSGTLSHQAYPEDVWPTQSEFVRGLDGQLRLDVPIFQGTKTVGAVRRAEAELEQARVVAEQTRTVVGLEVERARRDLVRSLALLLARRGTVELAERAYGLADVRYANGLTTQLELTDARIQMQTAQVEEARALADYRLALAAMEKATGHRLRLRFMTYDEIPAILPQEVINP